MLNSQFKAGDLLGFSHRGALGYGINLASRGVPGWGLSHVAMVGKHPTENRLALFESTMSAPSPCVLAGHQVSGVQCQEINGRIKRYDGRVWHYPLIEPLGQVRSAVVTRWWTDRLGHAYDTAGAIQSRKAWYFRQADLTSLFCSEACVAVLQEIGIILDGRRNASQWTPNATGRALVSQRLTYKPRRLV